MKFQQVHIGKITLGEGQPVIVQSMTNTNTADVEATVAQCKRMIAAGAEMVRITVPSMKEVESLRQIKEQLRAEGIETPLIADVHFNPKVAEAAAAIVEKVRVNPGNYVDKRNFKTLDLSEEEYQASLDAMEAKAKPLFETCKAHGTALRIGINHGSLADRIVSRYGNTPHAMAMSAIEWLDICEKNDFRNMVFSMKASNVNTMMAATLDLHKMLSERDTLYPIHLGVTEAGNGLEGRVKSAAGIGALLKMGIGNTIRVSLTEKPENETPFAHKLIEAIGRIKEDDYTIEKQTLVYSSDEKDPDLWIAAAAAISGYLNYHQKIADILLKNPNFSTEENTNLADTILQACRLKMSKTEFISCPSCGRTQYDIESVLAQVKERFAHYPGLKLAVMGCIVNGPGEMADADYGIVGATNGLAAVYKGKERVSEIIPIAEALEQLEKLVYSRKI
ncbi:MAG: (E)-4-hydroxy-3-methylbut-2-enyl-diphosphate synthase [Bacteroidales bacterium]|nr:(E)-4-hydroxy-3-methylbut-2-enyl-diphosphate synthase [Bacteroidales bacterium]